MNKWITRFFQKLYLWSLGPKLNPNEKDYPFTRYSKTAWGNGKLPLERYLSNIGFVEQNFERNTSIMRRGFVCIDTKYLTISHYKISKKPTVIDGNIKQWIDYFDRI